MEHFLNILGIYLLFFNILSFSLFGIDKNKAVRHAYRIPEKTLFLVTILGGSLGSLLGMYLFHHKTRHLSFSVGVPILFFLHILLFAVLIYILHTV